MTLAVGAQVVAQQHVVNRQVRGQRAITHEYAALAAALNGYGLADGCVVSRLWGPAVGYYANCTSREIGGHDGSITSHGLAALARTHKVAVIRTSSQRVPAYARLWVRRPLPGWPPGTPWVAYISP